MLPLDTGGSLTILEAETGSGKTKAALLRFAQLFQAGLVDNLYFALPTRTAATQIHRRVIDAVNRAFPEGKRPPVVLAVPGYLRVDEVEGTRLPGFEVLWRDDNKEASASAAGRPRTRSATSPAQSSSVRSIRCWRAADRGHLRDRGAVGAADRGELGGILGPSY